ncbi:MAG: extracellular solute-binding protein [Pseudomonadota bacterium]
MTLTPLHSTAVAVGVLTLSLGAASADTLVVYSPQPAENMAVLEGAAEAALGFDIEFVNAGGGAIHDRILAERNNPQADVVYGLIDLLLASLKQADVLVPYTPNTLDGLPERFIDPDGYFYGYRQTPLAMAINTDAMSMEDAPTSWEDLADPRFEGQFIIGGLTWQTTRGLLSGMFTRLLDADGNMTDEGWEWMADFYDNARVYFEGMEQVQLISSGETPITLNHFTGVQAQAAEGDYNFEYVDTPGGVVVVGEGNAIVSGTDQFDNALRFIEFASSVDWQIEAAEQFGILPAHPDAIAASPDEIRNNPALQLEAQDIDWDNMARQMPAWLEIIELDLL